MVAFLFSFISQSHYGLYSMFRRKECVCARGVFNLLNCPFWDRWIRNHSVNMFVYSFQWVCSIVQSHCCIDNLRVKVPVKKPRAEIWNANWNGSFCLSSGLDLLPKLWLRYRSIGFSISSNRMQRTIWCRYLIVIQLSLEIIVRCWFHWPKTKHNTTNNNEWNEQVTYVLLCD